MPTDLDGLARSLDGRLILPGDAGYDSLRLLECTRFDGRRPLAIVRVGSAADAARAVAYARVRGVPFAVRSGGHSYGGWSTSTGLVIDVRPLAAVAFDSGNASATVGAGAQLVDVYATLATKGRAIAGGTCPTVGLAGLALGGGHGLVGRSFGLTCDALSAVEIVTADGALRHCDEKNEPDLFWACRGGGGGNFGVVTALTIVGRPIPAVVTTFVLHYSWVNAAAALGAWMEWVATLPNAMTTIARLESTAQLVIAGLHLGSVDETRTLLGPLLASARSQSVTAHNYLDAMMLEAGCLHSSVGSCHLADTTAGGTLARQTPFAASSHYFGDPLSAAAIESAVARIERHSSEVGDGSGTIQFDSYGGAIGHIAADATAFVHRTAFCSAQYASFVGRGADSRHRQWIRSTRSALETFSNGEAYQNYPDPDLVDWAHAYYGANLARLQQIKRSYDPGNVFSFPQSIPL